MILKYRCRRCKAEYEVARLTRAEKDEGVAEVMRRMKYTRKQALYAFRFDYCPSCRHRTGEIQKSVKRGNTLNLIVKNVKSI